MFKKLQKSDQGTLVLAKKTILDAAVNQKILILKNEKIKKIVAIKNEFDINLFKREFHSAMSQYLKKLPRSNKNRKQINEFSLGAQLKSSNELTSEDINKLIQNPQVKNDLSNFNNIVDAGIFFTASYKFDLAVDYDDLTKLVKSYGCKFDKKNKGKSEFFKRSFLLDAFGYDMRTPLGQAINQALVSAEKKTQYLQHEGQISALSKELNDEKKLKDLASKAIMPIMEKQFDVFFKEKIHSILDNDTKYKTLVANLKKLNANVDFRNNLQALNILSKAVNESIPLMSKKLADIKKEMQDRANEINKLKKATNCHSYEDLVSKKQEFESQILVFDIEVDNLKESMAEYKKLDEEKLGLDLEENEKQQLLETIEKEGSKKQQYESQLTTLKNKVEQYTKIENKFKSIQTLEKSQTESNEMIKKITEKMESSKANVERINKKLNKILDEHKITLSDQNLDAIRIIGRLKDLKNVSEVLKIKFPNSKDNYSGCDAATACYKLCKLNGNEQMLLEDLKSSMCNFVKNDFQTHCNLDDKSIKTVFYI